MHSSSVQLESNNGAFIWTNDLKTFCVTYGPSKESAIFPIQKFTDYKEAIAFAGYLVSCIKGFDYHV